MKNGNTIVKRLRRLPKNLASGIKNEEGLGFREQVSEGETEGN